MVTMQALHAAWTAMYVAAVLAVALLAVAPRKIGGHWTSVAIGFSLLMGALVPLLRLVP